MQDVIDTLAGAGNCVGIAQIALNEFHSVKNVGEVLPAPRFKIIEAANRFSAFYERLADPGAKESGAAGHKITCHISSMLTAATETA
jgi:hypothetical protein